MTPTDRSILITGCSSGIGLLAARTLKTRGWRVLATARKPADLDRLRTTEGLEALPLELSDSASIAACAAAALKLTDGRLYAVYNNAAYGLVGAMEDISAAHLREHFEINVIAAHDLTRQIVPAMRAAGRGRIVMCSSVLGFISGPYRGAYCASKYALEALSDAMRMELAASGIQVSLLEPGPIETQFLPTTLSKFRATIDVDRSAHKAAYERRLKQMEAGGNGRFKLGPDAVVAKLVHALEHPRPKARYRIGFATQASNVLKRILPDRILDIVAQRI